MCHSSMRVVCNANSAGGGGVVRDNSALRLTLCAYCARYDAAFLRVPNSPSPPSRGGGGARVSNTPIREWVRFGSRARARACTFHLFCHARAGGRSLKSREYRQKRNSLSEHAYARALW